MAAMHRLNELIQDVKLESISAGEVTNGDGQFMRTLRELCVKEDDHYILAFMKFVRPRMRTFFQKFVETSKITINKQGSELGVFINSYDLRDPSQRYHATRNPIIPFSGSVIPDSYFEDTLYGYTPLQAPIPSDLPITAAPIAPYTLIPPAAFTFGDKDHSHRLHGKYASQLIIHLYVFNSFMMCNQMSLTVLLYIILSLADVVRMPPPASSAARSNLVTPSTHAARPMCDKDPSQYSPGTAGGSRKFCYISCNQMSLTVLLHIILYFADDVGMPPPASSADFSTRLTPSTPAARLMCDKDPSQYSLGTAGGSRKFCYI
jgi:hypothetical protein